MTSTTGTEIKDVIKTEIEKVGLRFDFLRGYGRHKHVRKK